MTVWGFFRGLLLIGSLIGVVINLGIATQLPSGYSELGVIGLIIWGFIFWWVAYSWRKSINKQKLDEINPEMEVDPEADLLPSFRDVHEN
jgi:hypothetical protein